MNGFCGSFSLFSSANYLATGDEHHLHNALLFPLGGLIFDFLDGKVARWRKSTSMLGQELDSLADLVCTPTQCPTHLLIRYGRYHSELRLPFWPSLSAFELLSTQLRWPASSAADSPVWPDSMQLWRWYQRTGRERHAISRDCPSRPLWRWLGYSPTGSRTVGSRGRRGFLVGL